MAAKPAAAPASADRNKEIQIALKNAGFYAGAIDGKIGPKTKEAIREFQKAKGLRADGKVGSKTWAELQKHLTIQ
jgi:peptidoglycan hydrolase-like protein with peptidoglycan-binding domain